MKKNSSDYQKKILIKYKKYTVKKSILYIIYQE